MEVIKHHLTATIKKSRAGYHVGGVKYTGITAKLKKVHWKRFTATRGTTPGGPEAGLTRGRRFDNCFTATIQKKKRSKYKKHEQLLINKAIALLRDRGFRLVGAQIHICDPDTKDATTADALAVSASGAIAVVELKTTQRTYERDTAIAKKTCPVQPRLNHALKKPNTELNHHFMQTGRTIRMLRSRHYGLQSKVHGLVVKICANGVRIYPVPEWATTAEAFRT